MERSGFNDLLNDIDNIDQASIDALEEIRNQYPYFQSTHLLLALAYKKTGDEKLKVALNKAAIYSVDRAYLKKILDGNHQFVEVIRTKPLPSTQEAKEEVKQPTPTPKPTAKPKDRVPEQPKKDPPLAPPVVEKEPQKMVKMSKPPERKPEVKKAVSTPEVKSQPVIKKEVAPTKPQPVAEPSPQSAAEPSSDIYKELDENLKLLKKRKAAMKALLEDKPSKKAVSPSKKSAKKESQSVLIEKFIKNEPQMGKQDLLRDESQNDQEDLAAKKLKKSEEFLTETYAKLLIKQKKYARATDIYEKLKLKFPKKTTYFASQIEKLKERGNV